MPRFNEDKYREEVLAEFLHANFYPRVASEYSKVSSIKKQQRGHDALINFNWNNKEAIVDEKAQNSDKWINSPSSSFVVEIFGESYIRNNNIEWNIGWFISDKNETEYYVFVWLPSVSTFKIQQGVDDNPYLVYQPASSIDITPESIAEKLPLNIRDRALNSEYRMELTNKSGKKFERAAESLPKIIQSTEAHFGEWYYGPQHIHEAKIAVVHKPNLSKILTEKGFDKKNIINKGKKAIKEGKIQVDSLGIRSIQRSGEAQTGTGTGENPVFMVLDYELYHEIADKTFHYTNNSWFEDQRLFI